MALQDEQFAFMKDVRRLLARAEELGFELSGGELERSVQTQSARVRAGLERSMDSPHLRRCAIQLQLFKADAGSWRLVQSVAELETLGQYWEGLDPRNTWSARQGGAADLGRFARDPGGWPSQSVSTLQRDETGLPPAEAVSLAGEDRPVAVVLSTQEKGNPVLRRGTADRGGIGLLQELLVKAGRLDKAAASGSFDAATEQAVKAFQKDKNLVADGVVGEKTWSTLRAAASVTHDAQQPDLASRFIGDSDFTKAAAELQVEEAAIRAVYAVESSGKGFIGEMPKILFEGHVFWDRLKRKGRNPVQLAVGHESILYPKWTKAHYLGGAKEFKRLQEAEAIDQSAARESASWGLFQLMGYHWQSLDYASIDDFVERMKKSEGEQLIAFCRFVKNKKTKGGTLRDLLAQKNWADFAYAYNGAGYRKNAYDDKLRSEYRKAAGTAQA